MIMKKLSFLFILALLPLMASAQTLISGIYYNFNTDTKQATVVSGTTKYAGKVTIPATVTFGGVIYDVTSIGKEAFWKCTDLASVIIPNSVTEIGGYAFSGCSSMKSATIGDGVINLGESSFYGCSSLTSVTIPDDVTSIGTGAFMNCTGLTSVSIPNSVKTLGQNAFYGCSNITTLTIGSGVSSIGMAALGGNSNLAEVYCYAKVLPTMGSLVFYNTNIANARLYVPSASLNAYKNADPWKGFATIDNLPGETPDTPEVSAIYYDYDDNSKRATVISGDTKYYGTVIIPETVLHNGVTYTVTAIGNNAFYGCNSLTSVTIPNSVTSIGNNAFSNCTGLTYIEIPINVTSIGSNAFSDCAGLTSITIPNNVTSIDYNAFYSCSNLTSVIIGASVTSIGNNAFSKCTELASIIVESGNARYDSRNSCNAIIETATNTLVVGCKNTIIPNSVTSIGIGAFSYCSGLTSVIIPNGVTSIGSNAFSYCSGLTSVIIPNSVTDLGGYAFLNCTGLKSVTIPDGITTIKEYTFEYCTSLTSVIIPNSVTTIGMDAFYKCTSLSSVTFGNSVNIIGFCSFHSCKSLTSVIIPNSVTSIAERAFQGCSSLQTVTIPYSVTQIGKSSFASCYGLTDMYCYARVVPSTNIEAFNNTTIANVTLHIPTESVNAYQTTEPWSGFGNFVTMEVEPEPMKKCATPTISLVNGKFEFDCETEGVKFIYTIIPPSTTSGEGDNADFSTLYTIKVYAKKDGYMDSEVATKEVNVGGATGIKGDVNEDGIVNGTDIQEVINIIVNAE